MPGRRLGARAWLTTAFALILLIAGVGPALSGPIGPPPESPAVVDNPAEDTCLNADSGIGPACPAWISRYPDDLDESYRGTHVATTNHGSAITLSERIRDIPTDLWALTARDLATGELLWQRTLDATHWVDAAVDLLVGPEGDTAYLTTYRLLDDGSNIEAAWQVDAFDAHDGHPQWTTLRQPADLAGAFAKTTALSPDGTRLAVAGAGGLESSSPDVGVVEVYDTTSGDPIWAVTLDRTEGGEILRDVIFTGDDQLVVGGSHSRVLGERPWLVGLDAGSGDVLWERLELSEDRGRVRALGFHAAAGLFAGGHLRVDGQADAFLTSIDPVSGETEGFETYAGPSGQDAWGHVQVTDDGATVIAAGRSQAEDGGDQITTAGYTAEALDRSWLDRLGPLVGEDHKLKALATAGPCAYLTGSVFDELGDRGMTTVALDAGTGEEAWRSRLAGPVPDRTATGAGDLALGPEGSWLSVTGTEARDLYTTGIVPVKELVEGRRSLTVGYEAGCSSPS